MEKAPNLSFPTSLKPLEVTAEGHKSLDAKPSDASLDTLSRDDDF